MFKQKAGEVHMISSHLKQFCCCSELRIKKKRIACKEKQVQLSFSLLVGNCGRAAMTMEGT